MRRKIGMRIPPRLGREGLEYVARWAKETGLDVLDLPDAGQMGVEACRKAGLDVGTVDAGNAGPLFSDDAERRKEGTAAFQQRIDEIADAGGTVMFACLIPEDHALPRKEGFARWRESFAPVVEKAEARGVSIALEGWPGPAPSYPTIGCTPEMLRAMFEAIPSPSLGICYDPSHLVRLGIDHLRFLEEFGDRVRHCHGKDTEILAEGLYLAGNILPTFGVRYGFSEGAWRYTIPGEGEIDWAKVALRLEAAGYEGPVCIELEDHRYWGSLEAEKQGISKSWRHLKGVFQ